jgi:acetolactate synthase-1/2/3 large subunit
MIPSGKAHNQMILGPGDRSENAISGEGLTLV